MRAICANSWHSKRSIVDTVISFYYPRAVNNVHTRFGNSFEMSAAALPAFDIDLPSPAFVVDLDVVNRNVSRMLAMAKERGVQLRPHIKTHKTVEGACLQTGCAPSEGRLVVSTLAEAETLADAGFTDILYAIPLEPSKLPRVWALHCRLPTFHVLIDSAEALDHAEAYAALQVRAATAADPASDSAILNARRLSVFLSVDAGYHREGADPDDDRSVQLAKRIASSRRVRLAGVYSHSGDSYANSCGCTPLQARVAAAAAAARERDVMLAFADKLRAAGVAVPIISLGATPSISSGLDLGSGDAAAATSWPAGLELHPGNYLFYDRQQHACGSCDRADIAVYVLSRVVARYPGRGAVPGGELLLDAGGCALHKDPSGFDTWGELKDYDAVLRKMTQEVSLVSASSAESDFDCSSPDFAIGSPVRVLPNHSCMTAACHEVYYLVEGPPVDVPVASLADSGSASSSTAAPAEGAGAAAPPGRTVSARRVVGTWRPAKFW